MVQLSKHRVLIINDDGIHATGIPLLEKIVRQFTENVVVPDEEKSGASHSISMNIPVRVREIDSRHFAIKGTPTDCALLAIYEIMKMRPTILLSGINRGANLAEDMTYSGTAAAGMEGALLGVPSVALSRLELRSLPSTGVTRLPRYYEPLRHPSSRRAAKYLGKQRRNIRRSFWSACLLRNGSLAP